MYNIYTYKIYVYMFDISNILYWICSGYNVNFKLRGSGREVLTPSYPPCY